MRVAHGCAGDVILVTVDDDRLVDDHVAFELYGHLLRAKRCRAHIDRNLVRLAVHRHDAARLDAALCLDIDDRLFHDAVVEEVLCDAADAVAAHETLAAVAVEHTHLSVCHIGRADEDDTVAADAVVAVGQVDGEELRRGNFVFEAVDINVVVAARRHLGERQLDLFFFEVVDVHNLRVVRGVAAHQAVREGVCGIDGREARDAEQRRFSADLNAVACGVSALCGGGDDVRQLTAFKQRNGVDRAFVNLIDNLHGEAELCKHACGARRGVKREAHFVEFLRNLADLFLIAVADGDEHAALFVHLAAGGDETLIERLLKVVADAEHFAGGFHFRAKLGIDIRELLEGEDRHLDGRIRRSRIEARAVAEIGELHAEADLCSEVAHRHARDLAEVRNRSRCTRVDLDDVDFAVHDDVLQVDEADGLELRAEHFGRLNNLCAELVVDILCRVDRDAVAGVDAGALYVLHDARDEDVLAVADGVDFYLGATEVLIDEHRVILFLAQDNRHVFVDVFIAVCNDHVLTAEHVGRAHEHRIAEVVCGCEGFLRRHNGVTLRALDVAALEQFFKALSVLCGVDAVGACADDRHVVFRKRLCKLDGRLAAERDDNALRLFDVDDIHNVFGAQRLKVESICSVEVCGNGFRVVVDDDDFIAETLERLHAMDAGIVELDTLTDTDRAGTENHDGLLAAFADELHRFVFTALLRRIVGAVEVRCGRSELACTGIDHLEGRFVTEGRLCAANTREGFVRVAEFLAARILCVRERLILNLALIREQVIELFEEPHVDHREVVDLFSGDAALHELVDGEQALVRRVF